VGPELTREAKGHVIPNMAPPNWRGIWYPKGFDTDIRD
jgi:hypothetical protein